MKVSTWERVNYKQIKRVRSSQHLDPCRDRKWTINSENNLSKVKKIYIYIIKISTRE